MMVVTANVGAGRGCFAPMLVVTANVGAGRVCFAPMLVVTANVGAGRGCFAPMMAVLANVGAGRLVFAPQPGAAIASCGQNEGFRLTAVEPHLSSRSFSPNCRTLSGIVCDISVPVVRQVLITALGARQSASDAAGRGIAVRLFGDGKLG